MNAQRLSLLAMVALLSLLSCRSNQAIIRMAKSHEIHSPVNNMLTAFFEHNYRYPNSLKELSVFVNQCPYLDAESFMSSGDKRELIRYLLSPKNKYLNAGDSCFFFSPIDGTGSVEYGNSTKIINSPWDYRSKLFHTSFQLRDTYQFSFESTKEFDQCVGNVLFNNRGLFWITSSYKEGNWSDMSYESLPDKIVPLRIVFQAYNDGHVDIRSLAQDIREVVQTDSGYYVVSRSINKIATKYALAIQDSGFFHHHPGVESVIFHTFVPLE